MQIKIKTAVSRADARALLRGAPMVAYLLQNKDAEICVDFEGVELCGHSFLDELFRVIPKELQIQITYVNTDPQTSRNIRRIVTPILR